MNIQLLPEEILYQIANYFTSDDLLYFSGCCKIFRRICFPLFQNYALSVPNADLDICRETWCKWKIRKIIIDLNKVEASASFNYNHLCLLLKNVKNVEILYGKENWEEFVLPSLNSTSIERVMIKYSTCKIETYQNEYKNSKFDISFIKSKFLYQSITNYMQNDCFPSVKLCNKRLHYISDCAIVSETNTKIGHDFLDNTLCYQHVSCKNLLKHLNLDGTLVTDQNIKVITEKYPHIRHLSLKNCHSLSGGVLNIIGKVVPLDYLSVSGNNEIKSLEGLSNCNSLTNLDVSNCKKLTDISGIVDIISNFSTLKLSAIPASLEILCVFHLDKLQELEVQNCYQVSDQFLRQMKMPKLRILNVSSCVRITGDTLKYVVCSSDRLVDLNLSWLKKISISFFEETSLLSKLFWRINRLCLSNMNITDECLTIIQSCNPISLKTLHLSLCKTITDKGILKIALICSLEDLNISHLCKITDQSIRVIASRLYRIKSLNITGCNQLTDQSIESLKVCRQLSLLECTQCGLIHDKAIENLRNHLPKLSSIRYVKDMS